MSKKKKNNGLPYVYVDLEAPEEGHVFNVSGAADSAYSNRFGDNASQGMQASQQMQPAYQGPSAMQVPGQAPSSSQVPTTNEDEVVQITPFVIPVFQKVPIPEDSNSASAQLQNPMNAQLQAQFQEFLKQHQLAQQQAAAQSSQLLLGGDTASQNLSQDFSQTGQMPQIGQMLPDQPQATQPQGFMPQQLPGQQSQGQQFQGQPLQGQPEPFAQPQMQQTLQQQQPMETQHVQQMQPQAAQQTNSPQQPQPMAAQQMQQVQPHQAQQPVVLQQQQQPQPQTVQPKQTTQQSQQMQQPQSQPAQQLTGATHGTHPHQAPNSSYAIQQEAQSLSGPQMHPDAQGHGSQAQPAVLPQDAFADMRQVLPQSQQALQPQASFGQAMETQQQNLQQHVSQGTQQMPNGPSLQPIQLQEASASQSMHPTSKPGMPLQQNGVQGIPGNGAGQHKEVPQRTANPRQRQAAESPKPNPASQQRPQGQQNQQSRQRAQGQQHLQDSQRPQGQQPHQGRQRPQGQKHPQDQQRIQGQGPQSQQPPRNGHPGVAGAAPKQPPHNGHSNNAGAAPKQPRRSQRPNGGAQNNASANGTHPKPQANGLSQQAPAGQVGFPAKPQSFANDTSKDIGKPLLDEKAIQESPIFDKPPIPIKEGMAEMDSGHKKRKRIITIIVIAVAAIALAIGTYFLLGYLGVLGTSSSSGTATRPGQTTQSNPPASSSSQSSSSAAPSSSSSDQAPAESSSAAAAAGGEDKSGEVVYRYTAHTSSGVEYQVEETVTFQYNGDCESSTMDMTFPDEATAKTFTDSLAKSYRAAFKLDVLDGPHAVVTIDHTSLNLSRAEYESALRYSVSDLEVISE